MKRTTAPGSSGGQYVDDNPALGVVGTLLIAEDRNALQEEVVGAIEGAGLTPSGADNGQLWKAIEARADESVVNLALFRNKIINGNLDFWQRGTSLAVATGETKYQADRFRVTLAGTSAATTYSRQAFTPGQTNVPNNPKFFLRSLCTNGGDATNGVHRLSQVIEDVNTLAGKKATVSFYAKADAAKNITIEIVQYFGTGGSPSADVNTLVSKKAITTDWGKVSATFDIPSISGKTIGSDGAGTSGLIINVWMSAGSAFNARTDTLGVQTGTFDFAQIQLEEGELATKFEERPVGLELALCQRYCRAFQAVGGTSIFAYGAGYNNAYNMYLGQLCMRKKDPTVTYTGTINFNPTSTAAAIAVSSMAVVAQSDSLPQALFLSGSIASPLASPVAGSLQLASGATITIDAEF